LQLVRNAQLHVVARELALRREPGAGEIAGARLRASNVALDRALDLAPEIRNPTCRRGQAEEVGDAAGVAAGNTGIADPPAAGARALRLRVERGSREEPGAGLRGDGLGLAEIGGGGLQVLVGDVDLAYEAVEHR